jgi:probable HAF family extracellular repeat protein
MNLRFKTFDVPSSFNSIASFVNGISNTGLIVGQYNVGGSYFSFLDSGGVFTTLPQPLGGDRIDATGVNDIGQIVGQYRNTSMGSSGFLYSGGVFTAINDPFAKSPGTTTANAINDSGVIVGTYTDNSNVTHAFKYVNGAYTTIDVPNSISTTASGINAAGVIVGTYQDHSFKEHGFIDNNGSFTSIDDPVVGAGSLGTVVDSINDAGQVVGGYIDSNGYSRAFLYSNGVYTAIDEPNAVLSGLFAGTTVTGINDAGEIVGYYTANNNHGFTLLTRPTPHDFNSDFTADIIWRNSSGTLAGWLMTGATISSSNAPIYQGSAITPDASWSVAGIADFNGDGNADLLWRQNTGALAMWTMNGSTVNASAAVTYQGSNLAPDATWSVVGTADFDGDGKSDMLWRQNTGALAMWTMNGPSVTSSATVTYQGSDLTPDATWNVVGVGDFDGDSRADLLWRQSSGALSVWSMNGASVTSSAAATYQGGNLTPDATWSVAGIGDFNGDGHADVLWRQSNGTLAMWLMNGSTITSSAAITYQGGALAPDASWSAVEIGDFNGDGNADILWRQASTGTVSEWIMNGSQVTSTAIALGRARCELAGAGQGHEFWVSSVALEGSHASREQG